MGETLLLFRSSFNESLRIESRSDRLTAEPTAIVLREIMQRTRGEAHLASPPTLSRLIAVLSTPENRAVLHEASTELAGRRFRGMRGGHWQRYLSIDVDSLPIEVHGHQPGLY